jgi:hypothetical protein
VNFLGTIWSRYIYGDKDGTFAAQYVGFARAGGSSYGVCLDCIGDQGTFQVIDGHDGSLNSDDDATSVGVFNSNGYHR